jgi:hypothetical protein
VATHRCVLNLRPGFRSVSRDRVERILFALAANRALAPSSKLAATSWIEHDLVIKGLDTVVDEACYRAMDWLIEVESRISRMTTSPTCSTLTSTCCFSARPREGTVTRLQVD